MKLIITLLLAALSSAAFAFGPSRPIPGRWIVVYKDSVADPEGNSRRAVERLGGRRHLSFTQVVKGFAATLPDMAVELLRNDPDVAFVEQDQTVSLDTAEDLSVNGSWGLDRIDQRTAAYDRTYNYDATGAGVWAFIIDTGIRRDHSEFAGRMVAGQTVILDGRGTDDCNGHGTHVAGTVGGTVYGVAKQVKLVPVRVLDCQGSGSFSGIIAGLDWAAKQVSMRPAVANMSLGGSRSAAVNTAVARAVAAGIVVAVAAGNDNADACGKSPASEPSAITVGATRNDDSRATFSNWGSCVDIFAPGVSITSAWNTGANATNTISGTSMATPHVTGAAALVLSAFPAASPAAVTNFLLSSATAGTISGLMPLSPNLLLFTLGTGTPVEPPPVLMAVRSLVVTALRGSRTSWKASATVGVRNLSNGAGVDGAVVRGTFVPGGAVQCTTARNGTCSMTSPAIPVAAPSTVFTVTDVQATGLVYDASQNSATQATAIRTGSSSR